MFYGGESNVPGAPGNLLAGGIPLRQLFPGAPSDIPFTPGMPGIVRPGTKQRLKDIFPHSPGGYGGEDGGPRYGTTPGGIAGTPSFDINRTPGALGGRSGEQLKRIYEGGTQQNEQLNEELRRRGIMPGGPQLPLAQGGVPMGNAGFFASNQYGQQLPPGYVKTVS
jgi:hypothetical protein